MGKGRQDLRRSGWLGLAFFLCAGALLAPAGTALAGTTGKISGRVLDKDGKPVWFAAVRVVGQSLGANTDNEGRYNILNVPPGTFDILVSHVAYSPVTTKGVVVTVDNTTWLDVTVTPAVQTVKEVVVQAERPLVDIRVTSARSTVTAEQIADLPVQELQEVVNLQAGVVEGHFRGGRLGEVQYQVDGVSVNDPYTNKSSVLIDRSMLQEVQVISGIFDAEYGQAMSGVVNAVLKEGSDTLAYNVEVYGGGFYVPEADGRPLSRPDRVSLDRTLSVQAGLSGPLHLPQTTVLLNGRVYRWKDYVTGTQLLRLDKPFLTDSTGLITGPNFDGSKEVLGFSHEASGVMKITNKSIPRVKLSYQILANYKYGRDTDWNYLYNPQAISRKRQVSVTHGFDCTESFGPNTFANLALRQNYVDYKDMLYSDLWDPRYDAAGLPETTPSLGNGRFVAYGADLTRFMQRTNAVLVKGSVTSQVTRSHMVKFGAEVQWPSIRFGNPGFLVNRLEADGRIAREVNNPPDYPDPPRYRPTIAAAYGQSQLEWNDFTIRTGLRGEYFDAHASLPSDLANPANAIKDVPQSHPVPVKPKGVLAPRLAMAYPVTRTAGIHFAYGHFTQYPPLSDIFTNADYNTLHSLQAGASGIPVMGNPDIKAERTVQYELGYKQMFTDQVAGSINIFYKDIRNLLGAEILTTYNEGRYARLANVDFGDVIGFTVTLDSRDIGPLSSTLDYTWQRAQGNSSDPNETATRAAAQEDPRPRLIPLNWDQRNTLNLTLLYNDRRIGSAAAVVRVASGQPYTPVLGAGYNLGLNANSGRKPSSVVIDVRGERALPVISRHLTLFGRVFNLLDTKTVNGFVFTSTGRADYSQFGYVEPDQTELLNPTRYYTPRRVELGLRWNYGM